MKNIFIFKEDKFSTPYKFILDETGICKYTLTDECLKTILYEEITKIELYQEHEPRNHRPVIELTEKFSDYGVVLLDKKDREKLRIQIRLISSDRGKNNNAIEYSMFVQAIHQKLYENKVKVECFYGEGFAMFFVMLMVGSPLFLISLLMMFNDIAWIKGCFIYVIYVVFIYFRYKKVAYQVNNIPRFLLP